ncbi:MAG: hypothetical protein ACRET3_15160, partial [Burkholderiales bacterium]
RYTTVEALDRSSAAPSPSVRVRAVQGQQKAARSSLLMTSRLCAHYLKRSSNLLLCGFPSGEDAAGLSVPVPCVVEIAFKGMHDAVQPCRERRPFLLDDLVGLLPCTRCQEFRRSG